MIGALIRFLVLACVASCIRAETSDADQRFPDMVALAKRAAVDRHIDMTHYSLSGRSWLSAEGEWTIRFAGSGPQSGHHLRILIRDDTKKAKVLVDK